MRMTPPLLALSLLLLAVPGCTLESPATGNDVATVLPQGDPAAGRTAFLALGCALCHRVTGDAQMPAPVSTVAGPDLGGPQRDTSTAKLVTSILVPTHRAPTDAAGADSTMAAYADRMTVRQLVDVVAFIRESGS